jgi:lipopolysaccharide/colanic/teichoic acid biosynthesis glycosyltransferase
MNAGGERLPDLLTFYQLNDGPLFKTRKDPRISRVGGILRRTGLDEVPALFNVLTGDMSLIGPRPILQFELVDEESEQTAGIKATPGLTGGWRRPASEDPTIFTVRRLDPRMAPDLKVSDIGEADRILGSLLSRARAAHH